MESEINKEAIPRTSASKSIQSLEINLTKEVQDLHNGNDKTLKKVTK